MCHAEAMISNLTFSTSLEEIIVQNFTIEIIDDNIVESTERVDFLLNVTQEGIVIDTEADIATVNIFNDDSKNDSINLTTIILYNNSLIPRHSPPPALNVCV